MKTIATEVKTMIEHTRQDSHKKYCIECGVTWTCNGCYHGSPGGICRDCRELQHIILELEAARLDGDAPFLR